MEVDNVISPQGINSVTGADSLWKLIHHPIICIFSDPQNPTAKQTLYSLFESLLKRSGTITTVLVPRFENGIQDEAVQSQYTAFTTWLFGSMFYIVGNPMSEELLVKSIEVQACMLRILSRHHIAVFDAISAEYIEIIQELSTIAVSKNDEEDITLAKFRMREDIIKDVELKPFSVVIQSSRIPAIQESILKIIKYTGVSAWNQAVLVNTMLNLIIQSVPLVKFMALDICTSLFSYAMMGTAEFTNLVFYVNEIVNTLPTWIDDELTSEELFMCIETLVKFIQTAMHSTHINELCFRIIDFTLQSSAISNSNAKLLKLLNETACNKIKQYHSIEPRVCNMKQAEKLVLCFKSFGDCIEIFMRFVLTDIKNTTVNSSGINVPDISALWKLLRTKLMSVVEDGEYDTAMHIFRASCYLQNALNNLKIRTKLFETDLDLILQVLLDVIHTDNYDKLNIIYECFSIMMCLNESNKQLIEKILSIPFTKEIDNSNYNLSPALLEASRNLDTKVLLKCLDSLCQFGSGHDQLKLLTTCICSDRTELAAAAVSNSVLFLENNRAQLENVAQFVLQPALNSEKEEVHTMLAEALGKIVCYLSGCAEIVRLENGMEWTLNCKYCDQDYERMNDSPLKSLSYERENVISPYLRLISSEFGSVRRCISKNILRFSNHAATFNCNEIAQMWLSYLQDEDAVIRSNIASAVGQILKNKMKRLNISDTCQFNDAPIELIEFTDTLLNAMFDALRTALEVSNHSLHHTLLLTAKNCACVPLYLLEKRIASMFLITILDPTSTAASAASAAVAYQDMAEYLKVTPKLLYIRHKKYFLKLIMQRAVYNYIVHSYNIATSVHRVARCIGYEGSRHLLRKDGNYAVCFLLSFVIDTQGATALLQDIAELIGIDEKQMLVEYFPHICSHAFLNDSLKYTLQCLKFVSQMCQVPLAQLISESFMDIFEELMLNFYDSPSKIIGLLEIISQYDSSEKVNFSSEEEIKLYLNLRLHGLLVNFDIKLGVKSDEHTKQAVLGSLAALIRYMGPAYITPLRYKILATLRTLLEFTRPGFGVLICDAWDAFIHNISIEELGPLLPTICISLTPLLKTCAGKINAMLEFLLVDCNEINIPHVSELFFIDDMTIPERTLSIVKTRILQAKPNSFEANLKLWLKRITHETDEVRAIALVYFKRFLAEHRSQLNLMILSESGIHPLIVDLLDTLLMGCQDKEESTRLLYGECLGELGAIEPSLLPRRIRASADSKFIPDMNEEFACAMLIEHVRAFQAQKSSQGMDYFAFAIQEILRVFGISPDGNNHELWNSLPLNVQQIITPLLTSRYTIVTPSNDNDHPHPIYGSESSPSVESWAYNWLCSMFNFIQNDDISTVLNACKYAFKRDIRILTFCLPYVVGFIITNGVEEQHVKIREEILAVIDIRRKHTVDSKLFQYRPMRRLDIAKTDDARISDKTKRTGCAQIIVSVLDYLQRWLWEQRLTRDSKYTAVKNFLGKIDNLMVAERCYQSKEYHRALMYLEQHMESSNKGLSDSAEGGLLAKIYQQLDEPDGVSGILVTQEDTPTLQQLVLAHEINGQLQDAVTCYERLAQKKELGDLKYTYLQGIIECYLSLDHPFTAKYVLDGILSKSPELEPLVTDGETFWRLPHFTRLDDTQQTNIKHVLLNDLKKGIKPDLFTLKKNLVSLLEDAARPGAYQQSYAHIMKLHILNEFDKATSVILSNADEFPRVLEEWEKRDQLIRASRGVEFVLSMRRATLDLAVQLQKETTNSENSILKREIGKIWLKSAKIARKSGLHQQAYMYILSASDSCPLQQLYIEQAQLYWQKGSQEDALLTLKRSFAKCFQPAAYYKQLPAEECVEERQQCAKAKLLFAKYNDETVNVDTEGNIMNYKEAIEVWRGWEKSLLCCAQYYESIVDRMTDEERDIKGRDIQVHMMNYYGKSLQYGCKYINQSMPRMLTIWLDYASRNSSHSHPYGLQDTEKFRQDGLLKMTRIMEVYQERLPTFMWLTAFSQLVSRICHPSIEVQNTLRVILVNLIGAYPQQCLWMMASVFNSSYPARKTRCQEILNNMKLRTPEMIKLIRDFTKLWERLIEVSNKAIPAATATTTISQLSRNLPRLLSTSDFTPIMIPTSKFRQMHLPSKYVPVDSYNPFSSNWAHIAGVAEVVLVMPSLQRPRRITLKGSDGKQYLFMCKPKDDLRKDFRLMEFNDIVNKYLQSVPESRQRRLYIRTYSVVPLNEECGLIEWVSNLVGLRPAILSLHKERGLHLSNRELKTMICDIKDPLQKKRQIFLEKLLPRNPSVLKDWFRLTFPDSYGWYEARTAFTRTTAVMSMVGYILGLGDRHGENILIDSKCGDCVHVDFNCLFNRGELLDWPERVPFRLTRNMVDAMGPLKTEGQFRRACEITMRVLRQQSSTLISVLTPFVYDPLVSWNKNQNTELNEKTNEKAVENIKNIEQRLKGLIRSHGKKLDNIALNLSVEGQTTQLILEATNVDNLCQMYFGWGAYQ